MKRLIGFQHIYYPETCWGGFTQVDGTIAFYTRVNSLITNSSIVLDMGCGRGGYWDDPVRVRRNLRILKGKCRKVIGVDIDPGAVCNPGIDEFLLLKGRTWPIEDSSVDLCLVDSVLEHVGDPGNFFAECHRVLKPEGALCIRTPNIYSYFGLVAKLIPSRWHPQALVRFQSQREPEEIYPTLYRCNTKRQMERMLKKWGFEYYVYGHEAEPSYLSFSRLCYFLGVLHQRFAPEFIKITLFAFGRKRINQLNAKCR
jgi:SAM-dependent methyltransferase